MPDEHADEEIFEDAAPATSAVAAGTPTAAPWGTRPPRRSISTPSADDVAEGDSPTGWTLFYSEITDTGDHTPELSIPDCFDPDRAAQQIAKWKGVGRYKYHTASPQGRGARSYVPLGVDSSGNTKKCPRRGVISISGADVIAWFGYGHVPGGSPNNLKHRVGFDDLAESAPIAAPGTSPDTAALLQEIRRLARPERAVSSADSEMEKLRMRLQLEREQRKADADERREEEERLAKKKREEEEEAARRKREEREEEDRRRKIRQEEELATRRADAEEQRIKDDAAHRRRLDERRAQFDEEMKQRAEDRKDSGGDSFGLLAQIKDMIEDEGGVIGLLRQTLGGGDRDDSAIGSIERVVKSVKEVVGLGRLVPTAQLPQIAGPAAPAPAPAAPTPKALDEPDAPTHPAFFMPVPGDTSGRTQTVVRVPSGAWGLRRDPQRADLPLVAIAPTVWPQFDAELARLQAEAKGEKAPATDPPKDPDADDESGGTFYDEEFTLADEGSLMWWRMLGAAAPEMVAIVETVVDQIGIAIESGVTDHRVMNVALMRTWRTLSPADQSKIRVRMANPSAMSLVQEYFPKLMPKDQREAAADPAIERTVEELLTAFRDAVRA